MSSFEFEPKRLKRSWGQHILINRNVLEIIASIVSESADKQPVIEVAAGSGNLTEFLSKRCSKVIAVEMERDMVDSLRKRFESSKNVEIIEMNMLRFEFEKYYRKYNRLVITGNLPYNLSKLFLFKLLDNAVYIKDAFLMFQFEVARRITAKPNDRDWSSISVVTNILTKPELLLKVGRGSFKPQPKVDSAFIHLSFFDDTSRYLLYEKCNRMIQDIFNYPRKNLRNIVKSRYGTQYLDIVGKGIDLSLRPQNLTIGDIQYLCNTILRYES
ncbi:MAG: 16S rRNA (adenine(1518)-N(6)/adenine(1519)-N(6))-dimethyltransferase RsmA [Deltaproteobacteria bacterium]|nr:16S rRNA (adenine(1518)-N(6)/adenine(1519)-N(6))-dimethyltransferase RsmA [Deltaproteobacteria bacterium]